MYLRLTFLMLILALPRIASADRLKVAVVPGIAVNLDAARVDALSQDLADALRSELDVDAVGGLEVRRQLPAAGLQPDCVANHRCVAEVAQRLGVQQLLFVVMIDTGTGGAIQIDSTWVDPAARKSASRPAIDIATIGDARSRFAAAAQQLLPDAPVRPKPSAGVGRMSTEIPRHFARPSYLTAGATVAGLGLGVSLGLVARGRYNDCKSLASNPENPMDCTQSRRDSIRTVALIADVGWFLAIGGAVATAVLYASSGEAPHVIVEPTPGGAAVTAVGRFW